MQVADTVLSVADASSGTEQRKLHVPVGSEARNFERLSRLDALLGLGIVRALVNKLAMPQFGSES